MAYFPAGSKEDELINDKIDSYNNEQKIVDKEEPQNIEIEDRVKSDYEPTEFSNIEEMEEGHSEFEEGKEIPMSEKQKLKENKKLFNPASKKFKKAFGIVIILVLLGGGIIFYKINRTYSEISTSGSIFSLLTGSNKVEAMENGQINILLVGVRGKNIPGGSLLADTIMVASFRPEENKVALISIPRDLYVPIPGKGYSRKINEANPIGEEQEDGGGLKLMKETVGNVTGLPIHYAVQANFNALRDTIDVLGGITVHLDKPFYEGTQFVEGNECGGEFSLPAGDVNLSGEKALCYSRARYASSDFDRARRQQQVLMAIKEKALSAGTVTDFSKVNDLINVVGDNVKTDMDAGEMKKLYSLLKDIEQPKIYKKVFDTSSNGLLYSTSAENGAYIILPKGDNFEKVQEASANIFNESEEEEGKEDEQNDQGDEDKKNNENDDE